MTCAVAFFGCSCSLLEDDSNESSVPVTTSEKSSTSVKTTSKPKPTEPCVYNEPKTDYAYSTLTDDYDTRPEYLSARRRKRTNPGSRHP